MQVFSACATWWLLVLCDCQEPELWLVAITLKTVRLEKYNFKTWLNTSEGIQDNHESLLAGASVLVKPGYK